MLATTCRHAWEVRSLTAVNLAGNGDVTIADSTQGSAGVCRVVTSGIGSAGAIATGR